MPRGKKRPYRLVAQDGADDNGGTLYVLYDQYGRIVSSSAWPQPLERLAWERGHAVCQSTWRGEPDHDADE